MKSVLDFLRRNKTSGFLIVSGFAVAVLLVSAFFIKADNTPEVRHIASVERPGYEASPEYYIVEASPQKKWKQTATGWFILGLVFAAASGFAVWYDEYSPPGPHSYRTGYIILVMWFLAIAFAFGPYVAKHGDSRFEAKMCVDEYEANKENLNALFPRTDRELNCN